MRARASTLTGREAGAAGLLGVAVLGMLLVAGLAGGVLVSTVHAPPVRSAQIEEDTLEPLDCPTEVAAAASEGPRSCRRLEVVNTGQAEGTAMCVLVNDAGGATARFADNRTFHHVITVGAGETGNLLVTVDGEQSKHDEMIASCGVPPNEG
jgi:hypothetical protein